LQDGRDSWADVAEAGELGESKPASCESGIEDCWLRNERCKWGILPVQSAEISGLNAHVWDDRGNWLVAKLRFQATASQSKRSRGRRSFTAFKVFEWAA